MAKYKAYPEYKDSGVEWLEAIPEHWKLSKLRYKFVFGKGLTITKEHLQDEGIPCVNYGEVHSKYGFEVDPEIHTLKCVSDKYLKDNSNSLLAKGDLVFADTSEDIDGSGNFTQLVSDTVTFAGYHTIIARPFERENSRFYAYLLDCKELRSQVRHAVKGVKVFSITQAILRNLSIWLPSKDEQVQIAAFLDHETAKIDNLIEKQQQLIELLKEKRQAVISHAVTKGLNPNVPMKNSGVEWLGEVPEHWKIKRCKNLFNFVTSGSRGWAGFYSDEGDLFFRIANLTRDSINPKLDSIQYVTPPKGSEGERSKIKENDLLISITADLGSVCAADGSISGGYVSQHVSLCRPGRLVASSRWLAYFVLSDTAKEQLQGAGYGGTKVQLSLEDIRDLFVAYPPKSEQIKIASYLDERLSDLDGLDHRAHNLIELLRERRTALISAAVTGKIDVRDWVAPDTQNVEEPQEATA
ncbi:TPA: restriction endonuclease subunit S [Klebsiella aerogenes]|nr:restriction endonuclease subunit S [Klebsiella aerogenes]EIV7214833.1 restriction endonuclease subunit S [Klebsiella aerogenes]EKZ5302068.1 restriction endonuclease subunit S [Klebsiella aerogenes]HDT5495332.1 restriction endonuclease subunit S [Klebsiella aerogenes]